MTVGIRHVPRPFIVGKNPKGFCLPNFCRPVGGISELMSRDFVISIRQFYRDQPRTSPHSIVVICYVST